MHCRLPAARSENGIFGAYDLENAPITVDANRSKSEVL